MPQLRVIYDMRGLQFAEHLYEQGDRAAAKQTTASKRIERAEREAAQSADAIICVSSPMASTIVERFQVDREKIDVVWNHLPVDRYENAYHERASVRESLGLKDDLVVGYCGSIYDRQRVEQGLRLFKMIRRIVSGAQLLAVTQQESRMRTLAQNAGIPADAVTTCRVRYEDTPRHLAAFDLGLITTGLFENPTVLANRVCCPVKFGEYLASGTPVIMSDGIGDYSALARREKVGLVLPADVSATDAEAGLKTFLDDYRSDPESWQTRCRRVAREYLDSDVHVPKIIELYERLSPQDFRVRDCEMTEK